MRPPALVLACVVSLACRPAATATPLDLARLGGPGLIFDDVHVFDGVADLGVVDVLVALDTLPPASNVVVISGGGKLTLLPGLIDAHAHVSGPPDLASALSHGVTTVLDQFMDEQTMGRIAARRPRSNPRHRGTRAIVAWGS
jgi:imidazolonepropionase-like amidohydrolase